MTFPEEYRVRDVPFRGFCTKRGDPCGIFIIPTHGDHLCCIASDGEDTGWNHVSITVRNKRGVQLQRCATWEQTHLIKRLFWGDDATVVQFHPPVSAYVNDHPFCLHLWRNVKADTPLPPTICV